MNEYKTHLVALPIIELVIIRANALDVSLARPVAILDEVDLGRVEQGAVEHLHARDASPVI